MKKLNNHGWGLGMFITFIAVFCIAIILITIGAIKLGISSHEDTSKLPITEVKPEPSDDDKKIKDDSSILFENYVSQIKDAVKNYIDVNQILINENDSLTITVKTLILDNQISRYQINGNTCSGYAVVSNSGEYSYNAYVNCGNSFISNGYDQNLDETVE